MEDRNPSSGGQQGRALRLTFSYEGEKVSLVDQQVVDRPTQPSAPLLQQGPRGEGKERTAQSGFWVELHGKQGRALYRLVMSNPIEFRAEVPDDAGGFTNVTRPNPRGVFFVTVPNLREAESVVLFSSPLGPEAKPGPAEPIARFPLRARREG